MSAEFSNATSLDAAIVHSAEAAVEQIGKAREAIATVLAVSGSINAIKHLQAVAVEGEMDLEIHHLAE